METGTLALTRAQVQAGCIYKYFAPTTQSGLCQGRCQGFIAAQREDFHLKSIDTLPDDFHITFVATHLEYFHLKFIAAQLENFHLKFIAAQLEDFHIKKRKLAIWFA